VKLPTGAELGNNCLFLVNPFPTKTVLNQRFEEYDPMMQRQYMTVGSIQQIIN
jgi:hypothetical protein